MEPTAILYPGAAMFFLTFAVIANLAINRFRAVGRREVSVRYYRLYNEVEEPPRLRVLTRHAQNHFEIPPLFYLVLLFIYVTGHATWLTVGLAWLYFASRCAHSYIHLGNKQRGAPTQRIRSRGAGPRGPLADLARVDARVCRLGDSTRNPHGIQCLVYTLRDDLYSPCQGSSLR